MKKLMLLMVMCLLFGLLSHNVGGPADMEKTPPVLQLQAMHEAPSKPVRLWQEKVVQSSQDVQHKALQQSQGQMYWQNLVCLETHCFLLKR